MTNRSITVDILKTIGLLCVLLAHIDPPRWLYHIRVFDVCMLVFASGLTLRYHGNSIKEYLGYLVKRFKRLIVPTWIFLVVYFGVSFLLGQRYEQWRFTPEECVKSFVFAGGIDYIWIIRVYFLMAVISPLIVKISEWELYRKRWYLLLPGLLAVNELLGGISNWIPTETFRKLFENCFVYTLGYSVVELMACSVKKIKSYKLLIAVAAAFTAVWFLRGFAVPQTAKYPPQALYILYGLLITLAIYYFLEKNQISMGKSRKWWVVQWCSSNSLWIYFWHILPVTFISKMGLSDMHFLLKFGIVMAVACFLTAGQNLLRKVLLKEK